VGAVTTLIGIAIDEVPAAGIIHQSFYSKGVPWWGVDNIAAGASESQGQPCGRTVWGTTGGSGVHGLEAGTRGSEYIVCTSRNKRHARTDPALEAIAAPLKNPTGHPALRHSGNICINALNDQIQLLYALLSHQRPHQPMPSAHKEGPNEEMRLGRVPRGPRGCAPGPYEVARHLGISWTQRRIYASTQSTIVRPADVV
jgi:hypothetical protein